MRIGSLFSGYGGLDLALHAVFDAQTAWVCDIEPGPSKVLAHRFPDAPNLGDITAVDWSTVEPVDILAGGFPCQDVSTAGKRAGMRPGTRSGLWSHMAYAIDRLRPALVVAENVRGLLSAEAHSDLEPCPWCVGDDPDGNMRALGAVLADLADLGYDAAWVGLRAADVGACHGRFRVFVLAWPAAGHAESVGRIGGEAQLSGSLDQPSRDRAGVLLPTPRATRGGSSTETMNLLPTPRTSSAHGPSAAELAEGNPKRRLETEVMLLPTLSANTADNGGSQRPDKRRAGGHSVNLQDVVEHLLPTRSASATTQVRGKSPDVWDEWTDRMKAEHSNGNGHGKSLEIEVQRLLPTPGVADATGGHHSRSGDRSDELLLKGIAHHDRFAEYAPAVARQETAFGYPAPDPTEPAPKGGRRLSCRFDEWMMGLPPGWVTDVPGITHNEALRLCGNGVVPQQAEAAIRWLLAVAQRGAAA